MINKTKIFLDSGNPSETRRAVELIGELDGQTTNPSLVSQNPDILAKKGGLSKTQLYEEYKKIIQEIRAIIPNGSVSIEVYADQNSSSEELISQASEMNSWVSNPHIKLPITKAGLESAEVLSKRGVNLNMTLCFSQEQAAAVYSATKGAAKGSVYVSPFIGRLDDIGLNGMDLIYNISQMFAQSDHHVELLTASVRSVEHFLNSINLEVDIITVPLKVLEEWVNLGKPLEIKNDRSYKSGLETIEYKNLNLEQDYSLFNIQHELTDRGLEKFALDWNDLINA